jgi:hypothetical protein
MTGSDDVSQFSPKQKQTIAIKILCIISWRSLNYVLAYMENPDFSGGSPDVRKYYDVTCLHIIMQTQYAYIYLAQNIHSIVSQIL